MKWKDNQTLSTSVDCNLATLLKRELRNKFRIVFAEVEYSIASEILKRVKTEWVIVARGDSAFKVVENLSSFVALFLSPHGWFSGRILACHAGGPGSIPGPCN